LPGAAAPVAKEGEEGNISKRTPVPEPATPSDLVVCQVHSAADVADVVGV